MVSTPATAFFKQCKKDSESFVTSRRAWFLVGVVEDDSNGVSLARAKAAHTVPKVDAIGPTRPLDRPMTHRERHRITLAERNHFWPRLHSRPLLGEDELTAHEIPLGFRQEDCYLYRENVRPVNILVQAVEVTFVVLEEQWRRSRLSCVVTSLQKLFVLVRISDFNFHSRVPAIRNRCESGEERRTKTLNKTR